MGFGLSSGLFYPTLWEDSPPLETSCPAYHAQGGQPTHQQPEEVEEGMEVDIIRDEQDNAVTKEAIALEGRWWGGKSFRLSWPLDSHGTLRSRWSTGQLTPSQVCGPRQMQIKAWLLFPDHPCLLPRWTPYQ